MISPALNSKKKVSLGVVLFVNFIFSLKYLNRFTSYFIPIALLIFFLQWILYKNRLVVIDWCKRININLFFVLLMISIIFLLGASRVPMESLNIDRWSVTTSFWDNYFNDLYVYKAKSVDGNYPGPMPFYFLIGLPFYLIEEYSFITVLGGVLLYFMLKYKVNRDSYVLIICTSLFFLYEVLTRSNIFFFSVLTVYGVSFFLNNNTNDFAKGSVIGLLLSTRNVYVIVFGILFLYVLKSKKYTFGRLLKIGLIALVVFALTFVAFVYNFIDEFFEKNPFIIQSSFLMPSYLSFACILVSLLFVFGVKEEVDVYFASGLALFFTILVYFVYKVIVLGFEATFWESRADITYFILCIPFMLYYLFHEDSKQINQI